MDKMPFRLKMARRLEHRVQYGWVIVGVMFVSNLVSFSAGPTFGLFITPLEQEFGWSRGAISFAPTLGTLFGASLSPWFGILMDRLGARPLLITWGLLSALALGLLSQINSLWQFYVLFGFVYAIMASGMGLLSSGVVITRWFHRRRGRAMAIVMMGASCGAFMFITLLSSLIENHSWRIAYLVQGSFAILLVVLPVSWLLINTPEDLKGKTAHEKDTLEEDPAGLKQSDKHGSVESWSLREAARTRSLWLTLVGAVLGAFSVAGYFSHAVPHMESLGFSRGIASSAWGTFFFTGIFAKFVWGFITEWTSVRWALVLLYLGETLGLYLLLNATEPTDLFVYAVVTGFCHGPFLQLSSQVWGDFFGTEAVGRIYGAVQPAIVLSSAIGPLVGGLLYDWQGDYTLFLKGLMGLTLCTALIFIFNPRPGKQPVDNAT